MPSQRHADAKALDEHDFEFLHDRYYRYLNYYFLTRGCSSDESQDLVQETFLKAFRGSRRFRGDSTVRTWLLRIADYTFQNFVRDKSALKRKTGLVSLEDLTFDPADPEKGGSSGADAHGPLGQLLGVERRDLLKEALRELPPRMRACLRLRIHGDLKYKEIATLMQISIQTVKSQLSQAKERLKDRLTKDFDRDDFEELD